MASYRKTNEFERMVDENSSQKAFQLRKVGKLKAAYELAAKLYNEEPDDEWNQRAYSWVLIDIIKKVIENDINKACRYFKELLSIDIADVDDVILKQIHYLQPKFDPNYQEVQQAESFSKNGDHARALAEFRQLQQQGKLAKSHHEAYGWAIYRYLKSEENKLKPIEVKELLFEYLKLNNPRPELLHSVILQFVIYHAREHDDIDVYRFFQIWGPRNLRDEDKQEQYNDGKTYPSLTVKLLRVFAEKEYSIDVGFLQNNIGDNELVIEVIRESYFWKIFNLHKNNELQELWKLFYYYAENFSKYDASHWHSEILKIAYRFMDEEDSWRFFEFFKNWGINNLRYEDWQEEINGEFVSKPLGLKAIKKIFNFAKLPNHQNSDFTWVLPLYKTALEKHDGDKWILRQYATILDITCNNQEAINIYKQIILELNDQAYVWHEFSNLLKNSDIEVATSMLCKAISIQKNEDFLGDVHIDLAKLLIQQDKLAEAKNELNLYKEHRNEKGWKLSEEFVSLNDKVKDVDSTDNNVRFHENNITFAEEYIYRDIPWTDLLLFDKWKTKKQKERVVFTDLNDIEFAISPNRFPKLKGANVNDVYQFKLHYDKVDQKHIPLKVNDSSLTKDDLVEKASCDIAVVDHVNNKKELFHYVVNPSLDGIIRFSQTNFRPNVGDFIKIKYFRTFNKKQDRHVTRVLSVKLTDETNPSLFKSIHGYLSLKYKSDGQTFSYEDIIDDHLDIDTTRPDFGFVDDYYVPKYLLQKHGIKEDTEIEAEALFNGNKWSVFKLV